MASTINAAISGLLAAVNAQGLANVDVFDGPPAVDSYANQDAISIGWQSDTTDVVTFTVDWVTMGAIRAEEHYDILCELETTGGDGDVPSRRARAIVLRDAVAAAITSDRTLAGAVRLAHMTVGKLMTEQSERGVTVVCQFTVSCEARINT